MRRRLIPTATLAGMLLLSACPPPTSAVRPGRQTIVAVDLSGSQTSGQLASSRAFADAAVEDLSYGDDFVIMEMSRQGVGADLKRYEVSIPKLKDSTFVPSNAKTDLDGRKDGLRSILPVIFNPALAGKIPNTDVLATVFAAAEYVRRADGRPTTLVLLSDMLQSDGKINFQNGRGIPGPDWIETQQRMGTIPSLKGVCVVVVGADASTAGGVAVKRFWQQYFTAAGATLPDSSFRLLAAGSTDLGCSRGAVSTADSTSPHGNGA